MHLIRTRTKPHVYVSFDKRHFDELLGINLYYFPQSDIITGYRVVGYKSRHWINLKQHVTQCYRRDREIISVNGNPFDLRRINLLVLDKSLFHKFMTGEFLANKNKRGRTVSWRTQDGVHSDIIAFGVETKENIVVS